MTMEQTQNLDSRYAFKGVFVPKEIWVSKQLKAMEKLIFVEIYALDREFGCVANNAHFADMFGLKERMVRGWIKSLKDKGLVEVTLDKAKDTRTIHVVGKFKRVSDSDAAKFGLAKANLLKKMSV